MNVVKIIEVHMTGQVSGLACWLVSGPWPLGTFALKRPDRPSDLGLRPPGGVTPEGSSMATVDCTGPSQLRDPRLDIATVAPVAPCRWPLRPTCRLGRSALTSQATVLALSLL